MGMRITASTALISTGGVGLGGGGGRRSSYYCRALAPHSSPLVKKHPPSLLASDHSPPNSTPQSPQNPRPCCSLSCPVPGAASPPNKKKTSPCDLRFQSPLKIVEYPYPLLRARNKGINTFDDSLKKLVDEMFDKMYKTDGIGLSAPQVGINVQLMVFNQVKERKLPL